MVFCFIYFLFVKIFKNVIIYNLLLIYFFKRYQPDYTQADPFGFGYHKGCDFVMQPCSKATWGSVYCSTNGELSCTPDRSGPGVLYYLDDYCCLELI